jgi:hypothetical protein
MPMLFNAATRCLLTLLFERHRSKRCGWQGHQHPLLKRTED